MNRKVPFLVISLIFNTPVPVTPQLNGGSTFLTALRGYNSDVCRFITCSYGEYCVSGVCTSAANAGGLSGIGYGGGNYGSMYNPYGGGLYGANGMYGGASGLYGGGGLYGGSIFNTLYGSDSAYGGEELLAGSSGLMGNGQLCAETLDCITGQVCQAGRCVTSTTANLFGPFGAGQVVSGVQPCTIVQDCPNGQICVNGRCSQSNVAFTGSQVLPQTSSCASGAICPVGKICMQGVCIQNSFSSTFACHALTTCPPNMMCTLGRCITTGLIAYG